MRAAVSEAAYSEVCLSRYTVTARRRRVFVHPCSGSACSTVVVLQTLGLDIPTHTHTEKTCVSWVCVCSSVRRSIVKYVYQDILSRHGDDAFLSIRVVAVYVQLLLS